MKYEIAKSIARGNGVLGIRIEKIKNKDGSTDDAGGANPMPPDYPLYLWNNDDGYSNVGKWIGAAARTAGR